MSSVGVVGGASPISYRRITKRKGEIEVKDAEKKRCDQPKASSSLGKAKASSSLGKVNVQETSTESVKICSVAGLSKRIDVFIKKGSLTDMLDEPIYVGRLQNLHIWDEYSLQDHMPLLPKYMFLDDNLDLLIIELPTEKHDYMTRHILMQLRDECKYIDSVGSGRRNHMEADERIRPSPRTPNFQLSQGVPIASLSTLVIEVGLSQKWTGRGGLDDKAKRWFQRRNALGLEYILCVKIDIDKHARAITDVSYKLYDLQLMDNFHTFAATHLYLLQNAANAQVQLDARRVLSIPFNQPLPQGFNGNTLFINIETSRDDTILSGF